MASEVRTSTQIGSPPERVWEVLMDPSRLGEWVSAHHDVDWDGGELARGSSFRQTLKLGGVKTRIEWTVAEMDAPRHARWEGIGPAGSTAQIIYELAESDGGTRFDYVNSFELPGGVLGRTAGRVASAAKGRREAERTLAQLKRLLEG